MMVVDTAVVDGAVVVAAVVDVAMGMKVSMPYSLHGHITPCIDIAHCMSLIRCTGTGLHERYILPGHVFSVRNAALAPHQSRSKPSVTL